MITLLETPNLDTFLKPSINHSQPKSIIPKREDWNRLPT